MRAIDRRDADDSDVASHPHAGWPSRRWVLSLVFGGCLLVDVLLLVLIVAAWEEIADFFSSVAFGMFLVGVVLPVRAASYYRHAAHIAKAKKE